MKNQTYEYLDPETGQIWLGALDVFQMPADFGVRYFDCGRHYYAASKRHARREVRNKVWGEARVTSMILSLCNEVAPLDVEKALCAQLGGGDDLTGCLEKAQAEYTGGGYSTQGIRDFLRPNDRDLLLCPRCGKMNILKAPLGGIPAQ